MTTYQGFIDNPGPFAPLEEWEEFRESMLKIEPRMPDVQAFIDEADAAIERLKSDSKARFAKFARVEWSDDGWRSRLLERAIGGDANALIVAGVMRLEQRPDSREALEALAAVTASKDAIRGR